VKHGQKVGPWAVEEGPTTATTGGEGGGMT
jgi:hypothetical protein